MRKGSYKSCRESQNTPFIFNNFLSENHAVYDKLEEFCTAEQATDDSKTHTHCMPDT